MVLILINLKIIKLWSLTQFFTINKVKIERVCVKKSTSNFLGSDFIYFLYKNVLFYTLIQYTAFE